MNTHFAVFKGICPVMSAKHSWNLILKEKDSQRHNYPELYDIQERVVVTRCCGQHFRFLSLNADQILLQATIKRTFHHLSGKVRLDACTEVRGRSHTHNIPPEVDVWEFFVDVLDGGLHALFCQEGKSCLWVRTGLRQKKRYRGWHQFEAGFSV